jgi:beta-galactosidase/beta-glucuronidase
MANIPRSEYPRPQFVREDWLCLNGEWQFEIDAGDSGIHRGILDRDLQSSIIVPFCPEAPLSGINNPDYMNAVWYRRTVTIPNAWADKRVLLHFQAADYDTTVWVNGTEVGRHRGGFSSFTFDLDGVAEAGQEATIVIRCRDDNVVGKPRGKQAKEFFGHGALYGRVTGIWQTVWLEPVPHTALRRTRITPDVANSMIRLEQPLVGLAKGLTLRATLSDAAGQIVTAEVPADRDFAPRLDLAIPTDRRRLWSISDPHLYDLTIELLDANGAVVDQIKSYAGLRSITIEGKAIKINDEVIFQRLVLDQGFYPDGIWTAPNEEALIADITLSMDAGFNGARLHQKVFEERFLYHADRIGYIVWGEFGDWGCGNMGHPEGDHQKPGADYITQWLEVLERDYSHPAIVGWCPLNETWQNITDHITVLDDVTRGMFLATKAMDTTRPVLDTSGYSHRVLETDVYDSHNYTQDPDVFAKDNANMAEDKPFRNAPAERAWLRRSGSLEWSLPYRGQPFFMSEFGGIWWNPDLKPGEESWGYGDRPTSLEAFYERFERLCSILLDNEYMFGYCYTQLTDVFQEQNGIYRFDRSTKFDMERIRNIQQRAAAIELKHKK